MIGKVIKVNDYNFVYGKETVYVSVYAAFRSKKNGNKYVVYSYDNKKIYCGTLFIRNKELIVMNSKDNVNEIIRDFLDLFMNSSFADKYETISLNEIESVEIIDESVYNFDIDVDKLYNLTIPKIEVSREEKKLKNKKKKLSFSSICLIILFIVIISFFFVNSEVIMGKNIKYVCSTSYLHKDIPASVNEDITLTFRNNGQVLSIEIKSDYIFNDYNYYKEFKNKSYFYKYFEEGDTYKFDDVNYTYRLFSEVNIEEEYFLPEDKDELVSYYKEKSYECKMIEEE